jgi:CcmD family protein
MRNRPRPFLACVVIIAAILVLSSSSGLAFQDSGFVPVKPGETGQETLPAAPLVFVAYGVIWTMLLGYVFLLWRRLGRVERELADVNAKLRAGNRTQ